MNATDEADRILGDINNTLEAESCYRIQTNGRTFKVQKRYSFWIFKRWRDCGDYTTFGKNRPASWFVTIYATLEDAEKAVETYIANDAKEFAGKPHKWTTVANVSKASWEDDIYKDDSN